MAIKLAFDDIMIFTLFLILFLCILFWIPFNYNARAFFFLIFLHYQIISALFRPLIGRKRLIT